jgi:hypothetical protein
MDTAVNEDTSVAQEGKYLRAQEEVARNGPGGGRVSDEEAVAPEWTSEFWSER